MRSGRVSRIWIATSRDETQSSGGPTGAPRRACCLIGDVLPVLVVVLVVIPIVVIIPVVLKVIPV